MWLSLNLLISAWLILRLLDKFFIFNLTIAAATNQESHSFRSLCLRIVVSSSIRRVWLKIMFLKAL